MNKKILLHINYIYIIIFIVYIIISIDFSLFNSILKNILPETPNQIVLYTVFFTLPHLLGSFISFAEKKYIIFYKRQLVWVPLLIITIYLFYQIQFIYHLFFIIFIGIRHVLIQQFYLLSFFGYKPNYLYKITMYCATFFWTLVIFKYIYRFTLSSDLLFIHGTIYNYIIFFLIWIFTLFTIINWRIFLNKKTNIIHIWNCLLIYNFLFFWESPYLFFALLLPRVIHDFTAFIFYIFHAKKKNKLSLDWNIIYRILNKLKIPLIIWIPLLSIGLARLDILLIITIYLSYLHYYIESFIRKKGSLHRKEIGF